MSREMTNKEAIANLNHIYGMVSPNIQRSLDVAIKALEEQQQGEWIEVSRFEGDTQPDLKCPFCGIEIDYFGYDNFCPNCGAKMKQGESE